MRALEQVATIAYHVGTTTLLIGGAAVAGVLVETAVRAVLFATSGPAIPAEAGGAIAACVALVIVVSYVFRMMIDDLRS